MHGSVGLSVRDIIQKTQHFDWNYNIPYINNLQTVVKLVCILWISAQ